VIFVAIVVDMISQAHQEHEERSAVSVGLGWVEAAVQAAIRDALIEHKGAGNPIAVWENNQVVWIQPEEIEIPEEPTTT